MTFFRGIVIGSEYDHIKENGRQIDLSDLSTAATAATAATATSGGITTQAQGPGSMSLEKTLDPYFLLEYRHIKAILRMQAALGAIDDAFTEGPSGVCDDFENGFGALLPRLQPLQQSIKELDEVIAYKSPLLFTANLSLSRYHCWCWRRAERDGDRERGQRRAQGDITLHWVASRETCC